MEHFKQLFGPGNSDPATIEDAAAHYLDLPDFLSALGFRLLDFCLAVCLLALLA